MGKTLVAYFSASGITADLSKRLAGAIEADVYEISPAVSYTKEDLDWTNSQSRSSIEMKDKASRPEISGKCENMALYDKVFVGFPIWWYIAPTIINTFLEQYDLSGKKVIPFATSGTSGMGKTNEFLACSCKGAELIEGKRFEASASASELKAWAEKYL